MDSNGQYIRGANGIYTPVVPVEHREDEYDSTAFDVLRDMQERHFWYLGRHRFILHALRRAVQSETTDRESGLHGIDLGGGCGGWVRYLQNYGPNLFSELDLADSSVRALTLAAGVVGDDVKRFQIDLLRLQWTQRWDVAFLLDVLEHIPEDLQVLEQIRESLRPGGLLFVTTPALNCFRTYNDDLAHHVRRYSRSDFSSLADRAGFKLVFARYFMFLLSGVLLLSRIRSPDVKRMTEQQIQEHLRRSHRVPSWPVNQALRAIFSLETPLGHVVPFPWGTSILAVLEKPR